MKIILTLILTLALACQGFCDIPSLDKKSAIGSSDMGVWTTSTGSQYTVNWTNLQNLIPSPSSTIIYVNTFAGIQSAINTLQAGSGGVVDIGCGNYTASSSINISGAVGIIVQGHGLCTNFNPSSGINTFIVGDSGAAQRSNVILRNFQIYGSSINQGASFNSGVGITFVNMNYARIMDVAVQSGTGGILIKIDPTNTTTYDFSEYVNLDHVNITQNDNYGLELSLPNNATNGFLNDFSMSNSHIGGNQVQIIFNNALGSGYMDSELFTNTYIESNTAVYANTNNLVTATAATNVQFHAGNLNRGSNSGTQNSINLDSNSVGWIFGCPVLTHITAAGGQGSFSMAGGEYGDNNSFPTFSARRLSVGGTVNTNYADIYGNMSVGGYSGVNAAPSNGFIVSGNMGVGSYQPSQQLDVSGTARFTAGIWPVGIGTTTPQELCITGGKIGYYNGAWASNCTAS